MNKFVGLAICLNIFVTASHASDRFSECVALSSEANKDLPQVVNKYTRLEGSGCLSNGKRTILVYRMTFTHSKQELDLPKMANLRKTLPKSWCTSPDQRPIIERYDIRYTYYDKSGVFMHDINVKIEDCKN
jgi:hypothetical protein